MHVCGKPAVPRVYGASKPCFFVFLLRACLRKACCPESLWGLETVVFPTRSHCLQLGLRCVHVSCLSIQTEIQRARVVLVGTIPSQHIFVQCSYASRCASCRTGTGKMKPANPTIAEVFQGTSDDFVSPYWAIQAGLLTPLTFARHRLSPLAAFTSGAYFLHNGRR